MPATEDASPNPSTPERRRQDDFLFSTPTCKADFLLKIALLERRYNDERERESEPSTPTCSADIEEQLSAMKKQRDDYFDELCVIMRKAGKKLDAGNVRSEELRQENARLEAELAELESSHEGLNDVEAVGTSSRTPETTSLRHEGDEQAASSKKPRRPNTRARKRETESTTEKVNKRGRQH